MMGEKPMYVAIWMTGDTVVRFLRGLQGGYLVTELSDRRGATKDHDRLVLLVVFGAVFPEWFQPSTSMFIGWCVWRQA